MDDSPRDAVIRDLIERLRSQISGLVPNEAMEPMLERVRASARNLFADLELVSRSEMARHLETVQSLRDTVAALEQRIRALESQTD
jgi:BMFP domain-containing protein YqiC